MRILKEVISARDIREFVSFPDSLYSDCPQYVPAFHSDQKKSLLSSASLDYCVRKMWLVEDSDAGTVGRICGIINPRYNERYASSRARFGWFDCIDDIEVARMLMTAVSDWASSSGMTELHGPLYYNTLGKQGMLMEGFDKMPPFNCLYNYPYYNDLLSELGFVKECDWVQYRMPVNQRIPEKTLRISEMVQARYGLHEGSIDSLKKGKDTVHSFFKMYNESFADAVHNFIPFTEKEIEEEAASVMPFLSDRYCSILLDGVGSPVAFGIAFPSISEALRKASGSILPTGWYHLMMAMKKPRTVDLMLLGSLPEWQNKGLSSLIFCSLAEKLVVAGVRYAVSNPQIEDNPAINLWNSYEREPYMRRRCYIKTI